MRGFCLVFCQINRYFESQVGGEILLVQTLEAILIFLPIQLISLWFRQSLAVPVLLAAGRLPHTLFELQVLTKFLTPNDISRFMMLV
jgi:hypothetical protein